MSSGLTNSNLTNSRLANCRLENKVAIVFGAGQSPGPNIGNGRSCAIAYAREGAKVACVDLDLDGAKETQRRISEAGGVAIALQADVTKEADCIAAAQACVQAFGEIDILHNNVGGARTDSLNPIEVTEESIDFTMAMNFKSVVFTSKAIVPSMRQRQSGCIINISSLAALCSGQPIMYSTTKLALHGLTKQMAMAYAADGIRVNTIMPGLIDTPVAVEGIAQRFNVDPQQIREQRDAKVPLRNKQGSAWDIAHAAVFLASDEANFITGVILPVDGGQTARIG